MIRARGVHAECLVHTERMVHLERVLERVVHTECVVVHSESTLHPEAARGAHSTWCTGGVRACC